MKGRIQRDLDAIAGTNPNNSPHPGEEAMVAGQLGATTWVGEA